MSDITTNAPHTDNYIHMYVCICVYVCMYV